MKKASFIWVVFFCFSSQSQQLTGLKLNLFFDVNKHDLTKEHLMQIDSAIVSKELAITNIKGFADSTGSNRFNMELSRKRARAVFHYLNSQKYSDSINIEYFGEQHPAEHEPFCNSRVEIWFTKISFQGNIPMERKTDSLSIIEKYEISNIYFIPDKPLVDPASFLPLMMPQNI